jgi:hypothetical protein
MVNKEDFAFIKLARSHGTPENLAKEMQKLIPQADGGGCT